MAEMAIIRRASAGDAIAVRDLTRRAYAKWVSVIGREPLPMSANYGRAVAEHIVDLLEVNKELVALVEFIPHPDHVLIENLAVDPAHQGNGWGGMLLDHVERAGQLLNVGELKLYTNAAFKTNIEFYQRRGYTEYARKNITPGSVAIFMCKKI